MSAITARVSRRPVTDDKVVQAVNKEIVPAVVELIDNANTSGTQLSSQEAELADHESRIDALETLTVNHESRIDALEAVPFEADFGDGASTTFTFTHGFSTYGVLAVIWDNATRTRQPLATESTPTTNTYQVAVASPPAVNELHIMISRGRG